MILTFMCAAGACTYCEPDKHPCEHGCHNPEGVPMPDRKLHPWKPNYVVAPAATLQEWMDETNVSAGMIAVAALGRGRRDTGLRVIQEVLDREPLAEHHALVLEAGTHISARMWLALEHNYRAGRAAGLTDAT